jgi:hypothetical protein
MFSTGRTRVQTKMAHIRIHTGAATNSVNRHRSREQSGKDAPMNPKRILARERRSAAIHEAGHVVIARRLGFELLSAWIAPHDGEEPDDRTWIGRVQIGRPHEAS